VQLAEVLHQAGTALQAVSGNEQVHVVRHQAIRVQSAPVGSKQPAEKQQVEISILLLKEAWLTIVSPLNDVHRHTGKHDAGAPRHPRSTMRPSWALTEKRGLSLIIFSP